MIKTVSPAEGEIRSQMGEYTKLFYKMCDASGERTPDCATPWCYLREYTEEASRPEPIIFAWICDIHRTKHDFVLHISPNEDFSDELTYESRVATSFAVYNFDTNKKYYWYVENRGEISEKSNIASFTTADEFPRIMYISEKTTNIRDCGGAYNIDGKRVKTGLLFRGSNTDEGRGRTADGSGVERLKREFRLKTDLDLRGLDYKTEADYPPLPDDQKFLDRVVFRSGSYTGTVENTEQIAETARLFSLLADESIYPAHLHCASGMDRTGTAMFIFDLVMRLDFETAIRNYELSCLGADGWSDRDSRQLYVDLVNVLMRNADEGDDVYTATDKFFDRVYKIPDVPEKLRRIFLE